jgi:intracellular sulfur oxidation DsrE/DsrF family protein
MTNRKRRTFMFLRAAVASTATIILLSNAAQAQAPAPRAGPVVPDFGAVYAIDPDMPTPTNLSYHAVFEVAVAPDDVGVLNRQIETVARYLNMHAQAGVPNANVRAALVIHGPAGRALLGHEAYREKYGVDNPDRDLIAALADAGVDIVMCGQTAMARGFYPELLVPEASVALSAMTALVRFQAEGYALIAF